MLAAPAPHVVAALAALSLVGACSAGSTSIPAPAPVATTTLVVRLGADTVAVEQYTRTPTRMDGMLVTRLPAARIFRYSVDIGRNVAPVRADLSVRDGNGAALAGGMQSLTVRFAHDSVLFVGHRSASDTSAGFAVRGPVLPSIFTSYGLYELALARMSTFGRDSVEFANVPLSLATRQATPQAVRVVSRDSVRITVNGRPFFVRHDARGGIVSADGSRTTFKVAVTRADSLDIEAVARAWAQREQSPTLQGLPSTRDTVQVSIGNAHLWVDYGRPALRGRDVWVNGVLGDTLWRTGANAATQFRSDVDLVVGGATVPAGTYTLWTATTPNGYRLVFNRQVGQWGTVYDSKRDLVRVPLRESATASPVERFTIDIQPTNAGAMLDLSWGTRRLSVPLAVK